MDARYLSLLVDSVEDFALFMLGPDGRIVSWNAGAERITGYGVAEAIGLHVSRVYLEEDLAAGLPQRLLEEAEALGKARAEGWRVRKDGSRFYSLTDYTALRDGEGRLLGFAGMTRDITARRELEAQLREAREALRRSETLSLMGRWWPGWPTRCATPSSASPPPWMPSRHASAARRSTSPTSPCSGARCRVCTTSCASCSTMAGRRAPSSTPARSPPCSMSPWPSPPPSPASAGRPWR